MCIHPAGLYEYSRGGSGQGRSISWTAANLPFAIGYAGGPTIAFIYDSEHNRIQQGGGWNGSSYDRVTTYVTDPVSGAIFELYTSNSGSLRIARDYIVADGKQVAVQMTSTLSGSGTSIMLYQHQDALGSVIAISDDTGLVREVDSYDPWGKRRFIDGRDDPANALSSVTPRGYTTQEMLPDVGLIHMNGRIYDPFVGRFLSADPTVEAQYNPQNWNRYSYVGNNPLRFTDPTGYCFLGCFYNNPIFRAVAAIVIAVTGQYELGPLYNTAGQLTEEGFLGMSSFQAAVISGSAAGAVQSESLQGALLGGASAAAFYGVGEFKGDIGSAIGVTSHYGSVALSAALHGTVGGLVSLAGGGNFQSGFLAAGFADLAGPYPVGPNAPTEQLATNVAQAAVAGGVGSILGGGKFANGAVTGAFGYLYNELAHTAQARARAIFGETRGLYPQSVNPEGRPGDPANWETDSYDNLQKARTYVGIVAGRNDDILYNNLNFSNPIEAQASNSAMNAGNAAQSNPDMLDARITQFFIRGEGVTRAAFPKQKHELYLTIGPFRNVGGGDVPRGNNVYIEFYGRR